MEKQIELKNLDEHIQELQSFVNKSLENIHYIKTQSQWQDSKLYWMHIRISNNRNIFRGSEKEDVIQLRCLIGKLLSYQNEIVRLTEDIEKIVEKIAQIWKEDINKENEQTEIIGLLQKVNQKIGELRILYEKYNNEQIIFEREVDRVKVSIEEKYQEKKVTLLDKIKNKYKGERNGKEKI